MAGCRIYDDKSKTLHLYQFNTSIMSKAHKLEMSSNAEYFLSTR